MKNLILAFTIALICGQAVAQELIQADAIDENIFFGDEIITTAAKRPQKLTEASSFVSVITRDEIKRFGFRDIYDAVRTLAGFNGTYDRNYHFLSLRGFLKQDDYNQRILVLVNGHPMNDPYAGWAVLESMPEISDIERIEVVRGPGSSLYGSNGLNAVINIFTRKAAAAGILSLSGEAADYRTNKANLSASKQFSPDSGFYISGNILDSKGRNLYFKEAEGISLHNGFISDRDAENSYSFTANLNTGGLNLFGFCSSRKKNVPTGAWGIDYDALVNYTRDQRAFAELSYDLKASENTSFFVKASFDNYIYTDFWPYTFMYDATYDGIFQYDKFNVLWYGGEARFNQKNFLSSDFVLGAEFREAYSISVDRYAVDINGVRSDGYAAASYVDEKRNTSYYAVFFDDSTRLLSGLILNLGTRYDKYVNPTFGRFSNKASLVCDLSDYTSAKLIYSEGFRAPGLYEATSTNPAGYVENPDIQPETSVNYEFCLDHELIDNILTAHLSVYKTDISNLIQIGVITDGPLAGRSQYQNSAIQANIQGAGGELKFQSGKVNGWINGTFAGSAYASAPLILVSRFMAKAGVSFPLYGGIYAGFEAQAFSSMLLIDGTSSSPYALANLTFSGELSKELEFSLSAYNLFDTKYGSPAYFADFVQYNMVPVNSIAQDGRNFRLKLTYLFGI